MAALSSSGSLSPILQEPGESRHLLLFTNLQLRLRQALAGSRVVALALARAVRRETVAAANLDAARRRGLHVLGGDA